jgi:hypothetical protein
MRPTHRRAYGLLIACIASVALLPVGTVARAQERPARSIVDGVVNAVCHKQIVLLGELPTHGEAHTFDAKSKIADRLIAQCGFTAILFEAGIYDFIGLERAAETRTATPEQLDNAIGRFWWTRELAPWRRALFEAATRQQVVVGGLDDQVSITSHYGKAALPRLIAAASSESTATECRQTVSRHLLWTYDAKNPFDEREQLRLQQCAGRRAMGRSSWQRRIHRVCRLDVNGRTACEPNLSRAARLVRSHRDKRIRIGAAGFREAASHRPRLVPAAWHVRLRNVVGLL